MIKLRSLEVSQLFFVRLLSYSGVSVEVYVRVHRGIDQNIFLQKNFVKACVGAIGPDTVHSVSWTRIVPYRIGPALGEP